MSVKRVKFVAKDQTEFFATLRKRVDGYFKDRQITRHANGRMIFKTIAMIVIYGLPLAAIFTGFVESWWAIVLCYIANGFGIAGIGLSIMHDANHGAYSKNQMINKGIGRIIDLIGGFATTWKIQHNVLHHSFTNVDGLDEDIDPGGTMRFSPHAPYKKAFRYQHIYCWFLYGMMTIMWITIKDFKQLARYEKMGLVKGQGSTYPKEVVKLIFAKLFYYAHMLVLPLLVSDVHVGLLIGGIFIAHFVAGLILALIFQPAHVMEATYFPLPDEEAKIENNWAIHQMMTTVNFANKNRLLSWYCGGLNYQVEHHLFPSICHIHYRGLSKIVKETAEEYDVPYNAHHTFFSAIAEHTRMLKLLGKPNAIELIKTAHPFPAKKEANEPVLA